MLKFPKGTCVVLMRHAETEWTRERIQALKRGRNVPARIPDKQDANLSPFGRVQAYLAGLYLRQLFETGNGKPRCDSLAYSEFKRAEQTANWCLRAARLNPRYTAISKDLNEQAHGLHLDPALAALIARCVDLANSGTLDPQHAELFRNVLDSLVQCQPQPFPSPVFGTAAANRGFVVGMHVNWAEEVRRYAERYGVYGLKGEEQQRAWRRVVEAASRSVSRKFGAQALPSFLEEESLREQERRKTLNGESFLNVVTRAELILRHLMTRTDFYGERRFLIVTHSKISVAIRQLIEGLNDEEVAAILKAEGPPFPPYVGMTVYRVVDGMLQREGEPYRLPPQLSVNGRELEITDPDDPDLADAQRVTGSCLRRAKRNGRSADKPRRAAWTFENVEGPRQAVASSHYSLPPPRDSDRPSNG